MIKRNEIEEITISLTTPISLWQAICRGCPYRSIRLRFIGSVKELVDGYKGSQKSLIEKLNKKIDGWVTYHKVSEV